MITNLFALIVCFLITILFGPIVIKTIKVVFEHKDIGARGVDAPPDFHVYRSGLTEQELKKWRKTVLFANI